MTRLECYEWTGSAWHGKVVRRSTCAQWRLAGKTRRIRYTSDNSVRPGSYSVLEAFPLPASMLESLHSWSLCTTPSYELMCSQDRPRIERNCKHCFAHRPRRTSRNQLIRGLAGSTVWAGSNSASQQRLRLDSSQTLQAPRRPSEVPPSFGHEWTSKKGRRLVRMPWATRFGFGPSQSNPIDARSHNGRAVPLGQTGSFSGVDSSGSASIDPRASGRRV